MRYTTYKTEQHAIDEYGMISGWFLLTGMAWQSIRDEVHGGTEQKGSRPYIPRSRPNGLLFIGTVGLVSYMWLKSQEY